MEAGSKYVFARWRLNQNMFARWRLDQNMCLPDRGWIKMTAHGGEIHWLSGEEKFPEAAVSIESHGDNLLRKCFPLLAYGKVNLCWITYVFLQWLHHQQDVTQGTFLCEVQLFLFYWPIGIMVRVCANGPGDRGSILSSVILKTQKMVLDASIH